MVTRWDICEWALYGAFFLARLSVGVVERKGRNCCARLVFGKEAFFCRDTQRAHGDEIVEILYRFGQVTEIKFTSTFLAEVITLPKT